MKRYISIVAVLAALFLLVGCSEPAPQGDDPNTNNPSGSSGNEAVDSTTASTQKKPTTIPVADLISKSEAQSIAFKKANVAEKDVSRLDIDLDYDEDTKLWEYEVDFYIDKTEVEVDINAKTGAVLRYRRDNDFVTSTTQTQSNTVTTTTNAPSTSATESKREPISRDDAQRIAFEKAGVTRGDVSLYRIQLDYDDDRRRWEYEIDFYVGGVEYDITLNATDGAILSYERETEDEKHKATATTQPKFISKDSVKKASLLCAGVDESKVTKYKVELEYDDDSERWEYEVTFNVGRIEYEILINAVSGELLNVEREIDD